MATAETDIATIDELTANLERDGIIKLDGLLADEQLQGMRRAFDAKLSRLRFNDLDGYQRTERYRHMVEDVLTLEQGFVDAAVHPTVTGILSRYLGDRYELVEAKGWKSLPTNKDFHGWHGDEWYDQTATDEIPREVKLVVYLTDVKSGEFQYAKGTHQQQAPRYYQDSEAQEVPEDQVVRCLGEAGSAVLFDTSGMHRQGVPILHERQAIFLNYHDPAVCLQPDDIAGDRYHPLLLNAAFLGDLTEEDRRVLGFGNKTNWRPGYHKNDRHPVFSRLLRGAHMANLTATDFLNRVRGKLFGN